MSMRQQTFRIETKLIDKERRVIPSRLSDPGRDRMQEEIAATAWTNLPRDFPILWQHDQSQPAIARGRNAQARADGLYADLAFPPPGVHEKADLVFDLITLGILTDLSVGFISHKQEVMPDGNLRHVECELLEASVVNIAANPRAGVLARALGFTGDLSGRPRLFERGETVLTILDEDPPAPQHPWRSWESDAASVVRLVADPPLGPDTVVRLDPRDLVLAVQTVVADTVRETFNRLRGRVD